MDTPSVSISTSKIELIRTFYEIRMFCGELASEAAVGSGARPR